MDIAPIREWPRMDVETFRGKILPANQPAVFRGFADAWPAVRAGRGGPSGFVDYLQQFDAGGTVKTLLGSPAIQGRFFYNDELSGLNFERREELLRAALARLLDQAAQPEPQAVAIQALSAGDALPGFAADNVNPLLERSVSPRLWISNATTVAAHFDPLENIACVAAGRRRFVLFPPEQISNLYIGPLDVTPAGAPVSLAFPETPDFARYPRYREALAAALTADLEPGDAIYIPYLWWHYVRSLEAFNVLVNYWWSPAAGNFAAPFDSIFHAILALGTLPPDRRRAWRALFDHYVFRSEGEPAAHLPPDRQGLLAPMSPELARQMKAMLTSTLGRN